MGRNQGIPTPIWVENTLVRTMLVPAPQYTIMQEKGRSIAHKRLQLLVIEIGRALSAG
jgi:hypothetical protein